jgi:hypothetical protein
MMRWRLSNKPGDDHDQVASFTAVAFIAAFTVRPYEFENLVSL